MNELDGFQHGYVGTMGICRLGGFMGIPLILIAVTSERLTAYLYLSIETRVRTLGSVLIHSAEKAFSRVAHMPQ